MFTADVELKEDPDEGLRIECLEPHVKPLGRALEAAGFTLGQTRTAIAGTTNIPATLELPVTGGTFDRMKSAVHECLVAAGVTVAEEDFSALGERNVRFNLENISLLGR